MSIQATQATSTPTPFVLSPALLSRVARGAVLALGLQAAGAGLGYGLQVALAHWMGTSEFGAYAYATTSATVLSLFSGLGLQTAVYRFLPLYRVRGDVARMAGVVRLGRRLTVGASILLAAIGSGVALAVGSKHLVAGLGPTLIGLWMIPSFALVEFDAALARAERHVTSSYAPWFVVRPLLIFGTCGLFFALDGGLEASTALLITLVIAIALTVVQLLLADRHLGTPVRNARAIVERQALLKVALPLLLVGGFQLALTQTDVLVVGALGGRHDAALYTAASKTALVVSFVVLAVAAIAGPLVAPIAASRDTGELQRLAAVAARWISVPAVLGAAVLAALATEVLRLFGSDFVSARSALLILIGGQAVNACWGLVGALLSYSGHQKDIARVYGVVAVMNLVLCVVLTSQFGITGAATATAISVVTWNVWLAALTRRRLGVHASAYWAFRHWREAR